MAKAKKFGAFGGVFTPSILTILGVIMFLRLPWIVGQAGLWSTLGIILVAHIISLSTGLSVASVATDKRVETGGSYYIISRSLGLPIGGTLGMALFVGLSFSVSLYLIGFAETFLSYFGFEVSLYAIRITGSIILLLVAVVTFISTSLAIKTQYLIMAAMVLSLVSVFFGSHAFAPSAPLLAPMGGSWPWIALFAIFFPAVTGFEAGVSMSGDLKNPRKDIPFGTIMAILVGLLVYVGLALFFSYTVDREMLVNDPRVLFKISWLPQLVIAGILGATLSSALGSILGAPRILQAVATDRIMPRFFAKGFGASLEPRNALLLTYLIAQTGILIGELNVIARIVTIFFIITYGFLNITYAVESWAGTDFRPSFKIPRFVSIIGALACIIVMIQLDVIAMIVASMALMVLFFILKKRELTLQTGDTWNSIWASLVKTGLGRLSVSNRKARNWRPNVILFSGGEKNRPYLIDMGKSLVGKLGIFTNFEIIEDPATDNLFHKLPEQIYEESHTKSGLFTRHHTSRDVYEGIDVISKVYGFSGFEPNTILMGWGRNTRNPEKFAGLMKSFKRQDYNAVFLHYDKTNGFGAYKRIDIWWSGKGRNLSLATTLLRFITSSKEWRGASIRVLCLNNNSSNTEALYNLIGQVLDNQRIIASVKVINNSIEQMPDSSVIHAESREADLCILELPEFGKSEPGRVIEKVNSLTEVMRTCLLISASSFFDEISIKEARIKTPKTGKSALEKPIPGILKQIVPATREIIANEVFNIGSGAEAATQQFFESGFLPIIEKQSAYYSGMSYFSEKVLDSLAKILEGEKTTDPTKAMLRLLNDFSYHSQKQIQQQKEELIPFEKECLGKALNQYLLKLRVNLFEVPDHLWIKQQGRDFQIQAHDGFTSKVYKLRKKVQAGITRKPVSHKIRLLPAVKFFIYHKRLELLQSLLNDYAVHSFTRITEVRKTLTTLHEIIEKARLQKIDKGKISEQIRMERSRLRARASVLNDENRQFFHQLGIMLYDSLLTDLNALSQHLDNSGVSPLSNKFSGSLKRDGKLDEELQSFPESWKSSIDLYVNKALLDFKVLSVKSRIGSKVMKYYNDYYAVQKGKLLSLIQEYIDYSREGAYSKESLVVKYSKQDASRLELISAARLFEGLFDEIRDLLKEFPERIQVGGDQFTENLAVGSFKEAEPVSVNLRKALSFFVGSEMIDPAVKMILELDQQVQKSILAIKDMVRLMNFSLSNEQKVDDENNEAAQHEQFVTLINNFNKRLTEEQRKLVYAIENIHVSFDRFLKTAFEPLSSATIGKTSNVLKYPKYEGRGGPVIQKVQQARMRMADFFQRQFVNLLYTKSEGMNWFRLLEKTDTIQPLTNSDTLGFVEKITPSPEVLSALPFYYCTLFSGQAGIGDDFWVGMEKQVAEADRAINRFKKGVPGALIVTGSRSSGKSSLSKMVAKKHFATDQVFQIRAPQGCTSDMAVFTAKLLEALGAGQNTLDEVFSTLPAGKVIIIQDMGLWWERKPGGGDIIELVKRLIDTYGHKCLFILTINTHALQLLENFSKINSFALATISCDPFDARELKEMILLRHHAGGLHLNYNKKDEDDLTAWDYARLFNSLFEQSFGNPGTAINLWLAGINKVQGKTIYIDDFRLASSDMFDKFNQDQWFLLLQFVVHRRFSASKLAANLCQHEEHVYANIRELVRAGILIEKFKGVYAIRPGLDLYLTEKLKTLKHL